MKPAILQRFVLFVGLLTSATLGSASTIEFGNPASSGNSFPFNNNSTSADRYQQIYSASFFSGAVLIDAIDFFRYSSSATFGEGDYELRLSTTSVAVNALDTSNFNSNVGGNDTLFLSTHLSGVIGSTITFDGADFYYDPSAGNLLLDIKITNKIGGGSGFLQARNGDFGADSSRAHNFGTAFASYGLRTTFELGSVSVPDGGSTLLLLGVAFVGVVGARRKFGA